MPGRSTPINRMCSCSAYTRASIGIGGGPRGSRATRRSRGPVGPEFGEPDLAVITDGDVAFELGASDCDTMPKVSHAASGYWAIPLNW